MIVRPTVSELLKKAKNRYELVIATSRRARQIAEGAEVKTDVKEESPVTLAANEIAEGKIKIIEPEEAQKEEEKIEEKRKKKIVSNIIRCIRSRKRYNKKRINEENGKYSNFTFFYFKSYERRRRRRGSISLYF